MHKSNLKKIINSKREKQTCSALKSREEDGVDASRKGANKKPSTI